LETDEAGKEPGRKKEPSGVKKRLRTRGRGQTQSLETSVYGGEEQRGQGKK